MRGLNFVETNMVSGGGDVVDLPPVTVTWNEQEFSQQAQACANDMMGAGGFGATLGSIIGGAIGFPGGPFGIAARAALGGLAGAAIGGGLAGDSSPNCQGP